MTLRPHDLLEIPGQTGPRLYSIHGIFLGALNQEDVVELAPVDRSNPTAHGKAQRMYVPLDMIRAGLQSNVFNLTQP